MTLAELEETLAVLSTMMTALSGTLVGASGIPAADLLYGIADLLSNADPYIRTGLLGTPLWTVCQLALTAGATIPTLEGVRTVLLNATATTPTALALQATGIYMILALEVQVYTAMTFTSSQDVSAALTQLNEAFDGAVVVASDNRDPMSMQMLISAHAAIVRDLTTRQQSLPSMITYSFGKVMTSHALAQRLYGDASRADQLVAENKISDPTFCPASGIALSE